MIKASPSQQAQACDANTSSLVLCGKKCCLHIIFISFQCDTFQSTNWITLKYDDRVYLGMETWNNRIFSHDCGARFVARLTSDDPIDYNILLSQMIVSIFC